METPGCDRRLILRGPGNRGFTQSSSRGLVRRVAGTVYVGSADHNLYAFDAAGTTNCTGGPKVCTPLWTVTTGDQVQSSPAVANGVVYVGSNDHKLYAYDATGTAGCSGNPKTCDPLLSAGDGRVGGRSSPAVATNMVYIGGQGTNAFRLP